MIKWCAFCQRFQGEVRPFERKDVSHGLCRKCAKIGLDWTPQQESRIQYLGDLTNRFWKVGITQDTAEMKHLINEAIANGVRPIDLLYGLVGPSMTKVGDLWARNLLTVQQEHQFTKTCETFIDMIAERIHLKNQTIKNNEGKLANRILIANVPGNEHSLGLRFTQLGLMSIGLTCEIMGPCASIHEIIDRAKRMGASVVGFSISMIEQLPNLLSAVEAFSQSELQARVILGGGVAVTEGLIGKESIPKNVTLVSPVFDESEWDLFSGQLRTTAA